jgi:hypothetical protein
MAATCQVFSMKIGVKKRATHLQARRQVWFRSQVRRTFLSLHASRDKIAHSYPNRLARKALEHS